MTIYMPASYFYTAAVEQTQAALDRLEQAKAEGQSRFILGMLAEDAKSKFHLVNNMRHNQMLAEAN